MNKVTMRCCSERYAYAYAYACCALHATVENSPISTSGHHWQAAWGSDGT